MSDLTFNKIAGAVLATGLAIVGLTEVSSIVFKTEPPEKAGYAIDVPAESEAGAAAVVEVAPDWGSVLLLPATIEAGKAITGKCTSCHAFDPSGANNIGPGLYGVVGRKPGAHAGFAYSAGMAEFGGKQPIWDYDHLYEFLKAPQKYISGTKMSFVGLKKPEDRVAVIAYLHSLGSTLPVPAPKPVATAPAAEPATVTPTGATSPAAAPAAPAAPMPEPAKPSGR